MATRERRMGRPRLEEAAALKELLLESATEMLCTRGVNGISLEALAEAAGITKRTIYRHFDSKTALIHAVVTREIDRHLASVRSQDNTGTGALERLHLWASTYFHSTLTPEGQRISLFLSFEAMSDPVLSEMLRTWVEQAMAPVSALVSAAQADGTLRAAKPTLLLILLLDLIEGPAARMRHHAPPDILMGGMAADQFFDSRWAAFLQLAGPDPRSRSTA